MGKILRGVPGQEYAAVVGAAEVAAQRKFSVDDLPFQPGPDFAHGWPFGFHVHSSCPRDETEAKIALAVPFAEPRSLSGLGAPSRGRPPSSRLPRSLRAHSTDYVSVTIAARCRCGSAAAGERKPDRLLASAKGPQAARALSTR